MLPSQPKSSGKSLKKLVMDLWSRAWLCPFMDGQMNKAEVMSGLFELVAAALEDAHDGSMVGQGSNRLDEKR